MAKKRGGAQGSKKKRAKTGAKKIGAKKAGKTAKVRATKKSPPTKKSSMSIVGVQSKGAKRLERIAKTAQKVGSLQKGRQQGSQTGQQAYKSNSQDFFRHPGQGFRGKLGGLREAASRASQEPPGSQNQEMTRPPAER